MKFSMFGRALDIGFIDKIFTQQLNSGFWLSNDAFPPIIIKENDQIRNRIKIADRSRMGNLVQNY